jgi:hypothetical protein
VLARPGPEEPWRGLNLIVERRWIRGQDLTNEFGLVWACRRDGKVLWQFHNVCYPWDARLLPSGGVLVAETEARRVTERDVRGAVVWEYATKHLPVSCERLPNGNTFIATDQLLLEVTRGGKVVLSIPWKLQALSNARKLTNGNVLCAYLFGLLELDPAGREVRKIPVDLGGGGSVEPLANGNYLVAMRLANRVAEVDAAGNAVWSCAAAMPFSATRLPNGNVLVVTNKSIPGGGYKVLELDRSGKEVWSQRTPALPFQIRRY